MSNNILKSFAVMFIGGLIGYYGMLFLKSSPDRGLASYSSSKISKYENAHYYFDIKVTPDELSQIDDGLSKITITVTALRDFSEDLTYTWQLPDSVEFVSGEKSGLLGSFKQNESKQYVLHLKKFSKEFRRYLSFEIDGTLDQRKVHKEVLISSRPEDSFEYLVQKRAAKKGPNLFNKLNIEKNKYSPENIIR